LKSRPDSDVALELVIVYPELTPNLEKEVREKVRSALGRAVDVNWFLNMWKV
jgi:hypothetical protein